MARRRTEGRVAPYLTVQAQLWMRELRRLLRRVPRALGEVPRFAWWDEATVDQDAQYAVQVYCRECGEAGLGMIEVEGRDELTHAVAKVGEAYLHGTPNARYLELGTTSHADDQIDLFAARYLCPVSLNLSDSPDPAMSLPDSEGEPQPVARIQVTVHGADRELERPRFTRQCPHCQADDALTILGSRAATLSSVVIGHLFQSRYNSDPKLLAFTDSVQDASHRAGFFAGRTFRFTLRTAMQTVIAAEPAPLTLTELGQRVVSHWQATLEARPELRGRAAATLLPPDLRDDPAYAEFMESVEAGKTPSAPRRKALDALLHQRIGWEVVREFGLGVVIGRSLEKTGCAVAYADPQVLDEVATTLAGWLDAHRPLQRKGDPVSEAQARHFLLGLTERMRTRGGVHDRLLDGYVRHGSKFWLSRRKASRLSRFGPRSVLPRFSYHGAQHRIFDPLAAPPKRRTWVRDWTARALQAEVRDEGITRVLAHAIELLASAGVVETRSTAGPSSAHPKASGLRPSAVRISRHVAAISCSVCGAARHVAQALLAGWVGSRCTTYRCAGAWQSLATDDRRHERHRYYRHVYTSGSVRRVFTEEHTGLLEREEREAVERAFKDGNSPDAPNLLACTPTLEMGIDIGDLSAVMLCSVPPLPANFVQRVGRAGRSTGNALVVTVANARPHDRYFFEQPEQMMRGDIDPPACFLDAPDMLKRQLVAHALDYWAARTKETKIPRNLQTLHGPANNDGFPNSFYRFYEENKYAIAGEFFHAFGRDERQHPAWAEIKRLINDLIGKDYVVVAMRDAFAEVEQERLMLIKRRKALLARKAALLADPSLATPHPEDPGGSATLELEDIEEAVKGYVRQARALAGKYPPNVLTDAGVLPNYAFPEPGVVLRATFRSGRDDADRSSKPDKRVKAEYQRPASAALREFAPFNSFYAEGRKIRINQIDLGSKNDPTIEHWRMCPECHHCIREDPGAQPVDACPECGSPDWRDAGQLRTMIAFRKAWSSSTLSEASTSDDSDEREQESYVTRELIEQLPTHESSQARLIDSGDMLFGYELWSRALLREINFGRVRDTDVATRIAGQAVAQRGFGVCRTCGRAQEPGPTSVHAPWCKARTSGEAEQFEFVSLYREMTSEAIRVLLPVAQHEVTSVLRSFAAALELGFRKKFGGQPVHLKITSMSEPGRDGRRQFLVIYDTVPGGTGYLAELWRSGQLFDVMQHSLAAMRECICARDESRDGCYRCVYAHQHQRDLSIISRRRAVELFGQILIKRDDEKMVPSLSEVSSASLLESELERQFVAAVRRHAESQGWSWSEVAFKGASAWRIRVRDDSSWELRPQVDVGTGSAHASRPDFVFVPIISPSPRTRRVAVFTDGFGYHVQPDAARSRVEDDIRKRAAILDVSDATPTEDRHWVWSLTYTDVQVALDGGRASALPDQARLLSLPGGRGRTFAALAKAWPGSDDAGDPELLARGSFDLLMRWLEHPDPQQWQRNVVCGLVAGFDLAKLRGPTVLGEFDRLRDDPSLSRPLELATPVEPAGSMAAQVRDNGHAVIGWHVPVAALGAGRIAAVQGVLRLGDTQVERRADGFEPSWRAFLQAWNLLQFHDGIVVSSTERLQADFAESADEPEPERPAAPVAEVPETARLSAAYLELLQEFDEGEALWRALDAAGVPAPEPADGLEEDEFHGVEDAHLLWPAARVALQAGASEHEILKASKAGWTLYDTDTVTPARLIDALGPGAS